METKKFEKFIKLMGLTTSSNEGEALNAIRKANFLLAEANLAWDEFLRGKAKISGTNSKDDIPKKRFENADEINKMFQGVTHNLRTGTSFYDFVQNLHQWWERKGYLTQKQYEALRKSYERI